MSFSSVNGSRESKIMFIFGLADLQGNGIMEVEGGKKEVLHLKWV